MAKRISRFGLLLVVLFSAGCASLGFPRKGQIGEQALPPEFFARTKRIAVQDFTFAEGVETNAFSPVDSAFLRSVIESKIVELADLEVITRKDEELLQKEMSYKLAGTQKDTTPEKVKLNLGVDAFIHGTIYEYDYDTTSRKFNLTVAVKIVATSDGRLWQSRIISVEGERTKHRLFDKLAAIVAKSLLKPAPKTTATRRPPLQKNR